MPNHRHSALREVTSKSAAQIDRETALRWADRAIACYARYKATGKQSWLLRAEDYRHEALEHAALAEGGGKLVASITKKLKGMKR